MAEKFDLIAVGDATVDTFLEISEGASAFCEIDSEKSYLTLSWAQKIPVERLTRVAPAGNSANVAVGASRLGLHTALFSILGSDDSGELVVRGLRREEIATDYIIQQPGASTNSSTAIVFRGERVLLVYHYERRYRWPKNIAPCDWIYFSSIGKNHDEIVSDLIGYVVKHKVKLAFNPGTYQMALGLWRLSKVIAKSEVFLLNKEEAIELFDVNQTEIKDLLQAGLALGAKIMVITDSLNGSYASDGKKYYHLSAFPEKEVERTGAGDAFAAGFVAALSRQKSVPEALRFGTANAASVVGKIGSQAGLLTLAEIAAMLKKYSKIKVEEI